MSEQSSISGTPNTCLVVFLKAPVRSKRRLAKEIGDLATTAATHLWACVQEDLEDWPGPVYYAPAEVEDADWLSGQLGTSHTAVLQNGCNLGERINHVDEILRKRGEQKLLFLGTDCPAMERDYLSRADKLLRNHDVVLGPATDGGVVLMGARQSWPPLTDLPWSTSELHEALSSACTRHGLTVATLEARADVDTVAGLLAARNDLAADQRPARRALNRWLAEPNAAWGTSP